MALGDHARRRSGFADVEPEPNPPDFRISLYRLEVEAAELVAHWTCMSERLPHPVSGVDRYTLRDGHIARSETRLDMH